jgi:hypothetical protein
LDDFITDEGESFDEYVERFNRRDRAVRHRVRRSILRSLRHDAFCPGQPNLEGAMLNLLLTGTAPTDKAARPKSVSRRGARQRGGSRPGSGRPPEKWRKQSEALLSKAGATSASVELIIGLMRSAP